MEPQVSVIIPVFNGEAYLSQAIESAISQDGLTLEVLVIDDGSSDRSLEIAQGWAIKTSVVRVLRHEAGVNRGVSCSRELGVINARADKICFLDADDRFKPGKLGKQLAVLSANPETVMVHTSVEAIDASSVSIENSAAQFFSFRQSEDPYSLLDQKYALRQNHICNSSVMVRAEALKSLPLGMDQLYQYEDWLFWLLLSEKGVFCCIPETLTDYRVHEAAFTSELKRKRLLRYYAHIELLLAFASKAENMQNRERALAAINEDLSHLLLQYEKGAAGDSKSNKLIVSRTGISSERDMMTYKLVCFERKLRAGIRRLKRAIATN